MRPATSAQPASNLSAASKTKVRNRHKRPLQRFPASGSLDFIAMDTLESLPKTNQGNQYVRVMTGRYSNLTRAIPMSKTPFTNMANIFLDHSIDPFGLFTYLLTDSGSQFPCIFLTLVCGHLSVPHLVTTTYRLRTNGQAK